MTTEEKALALVNEVTDSRADDIEDFSPSELRLALYRTIEAHEADNARNEQQLADQAKVFSDAVALALTVEDRQNNTRAWRWLSPFILPEPEPDPLVEAEDPIDALVDLLAPVLTHSQGMAARERENRFRNAMATIMAKIERIEQ